MSALFASGRIVDLVLGFTVLEALAIIAYFRRTGRGLAPADLLTNLAAGTCLMLALRVVLADGWWGYLALCLTAALLAHLLDLRRRWISG